MTKRELVEIIECMGLTSEDGEDYGDTHGRYVRFRAPKVTEGTAAVLWQVPGSGIPQRRVVPFAEVPALLVAAL